MSNFLSHKSVILFSGIVKILLIFASIIFNIWFVIIPITIIIVEMVIKLNGKSETFNEEILEEDDNYVESESSETSEELFRELDQLKDELKKSNDKIVDIYRKFKGSEIALENTEKLSNVSINTVQTKVNAITNDIFAMINNSRKMSEEISLLVNQLTNGDDSLHSVMTKLNISIDDIDNISTKLEEVNGVITKDTSQISDSLLEVRNYTGNILDLAEQTSVLAINASIEAARSGVHGKGFAVIAGEVGKLAERSKNFSETIINMVNSASRSMDDALLKQNTLFKEVESMLSNSQDEVHVVLNSLLPIIDSISTSITNSSKSSDSMTEQLNTFTTSMQFLDLIRQIVEHITIINRERWEDMSQEFKSCDYAVDMTSLKEKIVKEVTKHFTSREEWEALGIKIEENMSRNKRSNDLKGDVLLF